MRESWLKYKQPKPIRVPSGVLALEIVSVPRSLGTRAIWNDGKHQRVEESLTAFIAELFATADANAIDPIVSVRNKLDAVLAPHKPDGEMET